MMINNLVFENLNKHIMRNIRDDDHPILKVQNKISDTIEDHPIATGLVAGGIAGYNLHKIRQKSRQKYKDKIISDYRKQKEDEKTDN